MGEADRYQEYKKPRKRFTLGQDNNALTALFALNVIFFLILLLIQVGFLVSERSLQSFETEVLRWMALPSDWLTFSERPWTILTYMFGDAGFNLMQLVGNLFWLWAFGYILQSQAGNDKIIPIYLYGGIAGGLFFLLAHTVMPNLHDQAGHSFLIGANAATMAIAMATTTLVPNYRFFTQIRNGIPIWVLLGLYILVDLAGIARLSAAYSLSHLGGALAGFLFVFFLRKGYDGSAWMNRFYFWLMHVFSPKPSPKGEALKKKIFYESGGRAPYQKSTIVTQQRVDEILDKINQKGYHFLTEEEKEFLKKASEDSD